MVKAALMGLTKIGDLTPRRMLIDKVIIGL
jgi:hypothetical protein